MKGCAGRSLIVTASVAADFVTLTWSADDASCSMVVSTRVAALVGPCLAGAPPEAPWGEALP